MQCLKRCLLVVLGTFAALAAACAVSAYHLAGWLARADAPERAGAIIVLGGDASRALEAADLYRGGWAPKVYITAPARDPSLRRLDEAGIAAPREEDLTRRALLARGVPETAIELLGRELLSTAQEANAARGRLADVPGALIVVTSPYHVRRARMVFHDALPERRMLFIGSRYEPMPERWWSDQAAARNVLLEGAKAAYYVIGGRF